jgi:hypothetical protein
MISGPTATFSVTSSSFTLPSMTLTAPTVGAVPTPDVAVTPGGVTTTTVLSFVTYAPAQTPDGVETEFVFDFIPTTVIYNGQMRFENVGYTRAGYTIQLIDGSATVFAPETGASIRATL